MNFLAALAAKLIEWFLTWIIGVVTTIVKEQKELDEEKARAAENLKKLREAKTPEERRRRAEDLLNDN